MFYCYRLAQTSLHGLGDLFSQLGLLLLELIDLLGLLPLGLLTLLDLLRNLERMVLR